MVLARIISSWSKYVVCTEATPWIHRCAAILSVLLQLVKTWTCCTLLWCVGLFWSTQITKWEVTLWLWWPPVLKFDFIKVWKPKFLLNQCQKEFLDLRIRGVLERKRWLSSCVHLLSEKTIIKLCLKRFDHYDGFESFFFIFTVRMMLEWNLDI